MNIDDLINGQNEAVPEAPKTNSKDAATDRQIEYLRSLGYKGPANLTKAEASKKIDEFKKTPGAQSATEKQIEFLRNLGYTGPGEISKAEASRLIEELKAKKAEEPDEHVPDWL